MSGRVLVAVVLSCVACRHDRGSTSASSSPPASAPTPDASWMTLNPITYFIGDWTAQVENPQTHQKFVLTYSVKPVLKGAWLEGNGVAQELGLEIRDYWKVDANSEITRTLFDSTGITGTVRGAWAGDVLVLEGEISGGAKVRETITRRGERAFDAVWESNTDGTWSAYSIEHLTR